MSNRNKEYENQDESSFDLSNAPNNTSDKNEFNDNSNIELNDIIDIKKYNLSSESEDSEIGELNWRIDRKG